MPYINTDSLLTKEGVFDEQLFRESAEIIVSKLAEYLADSSTRGLALSNPYDLSQTAKEIMRQGKNSSTLYNQEKLEAIIDLYIKTGIQVYSPGYMGRQFSGVMPLAGLIDLIS
ncbi:MAG: hypothetical protein ACKN9K_12750, partial [Dolichospermum sp.]